MVSIAADNLLAEAARRTPRDPGERVGPGYFATELTKALVGDILRALHTHSYSLNAVSIAFDAAASPGSLKVQLEIGRAG